MLLAIDAGNTNIVFAVYDGDTQLDTCRMETSGKIPESIHEIVKQYPTITDVIISSVVPKINDVLEKSCDYLLKVKPVFINHENVNMDVVIDQPEQLGADRLVGAYAAVRLYQKPVIIVDFGTSTNFDVINAKGQHIGGVLATGARLSLNALTAAAAKLPEIKIEKPKGVIGRNTVDAMESGIYYGYIGMVEGIIKNIKDEMNDTQDVFVVATGGLSTLFAQGTDVFDTVDADLLMKGLMLVHSDNIAAQNRKSA